MLTFDPTTFGTLNADDYDAAHDPGTTDAAVALIAEIAGGGRILELAIGTGRIALPLAAKGLDVSGIEGSPDMVAKLREKPGGAAIPVVIGDMADVGIDGPFDHICLVFNTLFNLTSQAAQVRCFANVAARLAPGGSFLIECFVPDLRPFDNHQRVSTRKLDMTNVWIEAVQHDPVGQRLDYQRIRISAEGMRLVPLALRYAYPPELDLMAALAGLRLEQRWGGYDRSAFTGDSRMHVSVYRKPGLQD